MVSPHALLEKFPLSEKNREFIGNSRKTAKSLLQGNTEKLVILVGPCSIHNIESALTYGARLKRLSDYVQDSLFLVMRVYVEKPRTTVGWKGFLYDPFLNGSGNLMEGLALTRSLFLELTKIGLPIATEFVNPLVAPFFQDLITWGFIGARTAASQTHRELASNLSFPVGFKNTIEGNLSLPINSMIASKTSHTFFHIDSQGTLNAITSPGNPSCHLVLRGSDLETNYDAESIQYAYELQKSLGLSQHIMVDCAHGNSNKDPVRQKEVFLKVLNQFHSHQTPLLGIMLESFLESGNQPLELGSPPSPNISITDPCLSWSETESLILTAHEALQSYACSG